MTIGKVKEDLEEGVVALEGGHHQEVEDEEVSEVVGEDLVALDEVITKVCRIVNKTIEFILIFNATFNTISILS